MRIAEEILNEVYNSEKYSMYDTFSETIAIEAINKARKEVLEECLDIVNEQADSSHFELIHCNIKKLINNLK